MKKIEYVYREILYQALENHNLLFTQSALSKDFNISLSTVNHALRPLVGMGAVEVKPRGCCLIDTKKALYHWASIRNLSKDILYATRVSTSAAKIESNMPAEAVFAAYSAYKFRFEDVPADYSEIYVYAEKPEITQRFPPAPKSVPNLFVLKKDDFMQRYGRLATIAQTFVDLWNLKEWYAKEFITALEAKINGILEQRAD